jgi:cytochrome c556
MRKTTLVAAAVLASAAIGLTQVQAQAPAPTPTPVADVVAVRQAGMGVLYGTWRGLRTAVETKADPKNYILALKGVVAFGRQIPALFPPGSGTGRIGFPSIYEDRAGFEKSAAEMVAAAEAALKAAQANDAEAFATSVKAVSDACGNCHPRRYSDNWNK